VNLSGAVLLSAPDTLERHVRKQLTNVMKYGDGRVVVLGVEDRPGAAMGRWHICRPGTWDPPKGNGGGIGPEGGDLVYAKALCGIYVVSNGYAADHRPPVGLLCPACFERL
jgi:hypothetical protein